MRLVASSWSDNPRKGAETLAWLDRNLDPDRFELTFAGRPPTRVRALPRRRAARVERARRPAPDAGRVHRSEPRRPVLECIARSARVRPARRVPRQRRAPGARRRGRAPVSGGRGARRRARSPRRRARRAPSGDLDPVARVGRGQLPRGARPARGRLDSRDDGELPATGHPWRALPCRQAARSGRDLARPRRPLPVGRVDRGDVARRPGAQEPARPLGLPGDHVRDAAGARVETGTYRGGSAFFLASICDLLGAGEVVSIDIEPVRDDYPEPSADHLPRRPLLDRSRTSSPRSVPAPRGSGRS